MEIRIKNFYYNIFEDYFYSIFYDHMEILVIYWYISNLKAYPLGDRVHHGRAAYAVPVVSKKSIVNTFK